MFFFLIFFPVLIVVLPLLSMLGIPFSAMLLIAGLFLALCTVFVKWMCDGGDFSYFWCLIPAGLAALCFVGSRLISDDLNLMQLIGRLFN